MEPLMLCCKGPSGVSNSLGRVNNDTYLKKLDNVVLSVVVDLDDIPGDCVTRNVLDSRVEILKDLVEFWVLNNGKRAVTPGNPDT